MMTDQQINAAITARMPAGIIEGVRWLFGGAWIIFDPCNDLNAVQEAVSNLPRNQLYSFEQWLISIVRRDTIKTVEKDWTYISVCATAQQRAEAVLRATGDWKE